MPYIGYEPAKKPLTSADITDGVITSASISDGTIANADIANSTINLTTKVTGTLPVANGGTGLAALGTSLQVLRTNTGATALEFATLSSDYVLLASTDASSSATVSFDGYFSATYKNYELILSDILPATNNTNFTMRLRKSNADITTSNYRTASHQIWSLSTSASAQQRSSWNGSSIEALTNSQYNVATQSGNGRFTLYNPLGTTSHKKGSWIYNAIGSDAGTDGIFHIQGSFQLVDNANALSGITFYFSSGNIASGNFKLYGIK